jgi:2-deoxy-D-gluconate 3-dehydrogenase
VSDKVSDESRVAMVSGASCGIGNATALGLAADGFKVVMTSLNKDGLGDTVRRIEENGGEALALTLDVRVQESIEKCFADAVAKFGHVDVLVNNAAVPTPRKPIVETTRADWDEIMDVNVTGAYFLAQQFAIRLIEQKRPGQIINLSSTFAYVGVPNVSVYGISKTALGGMTRMMAIEWAPLGIRANAVAPGATATESRAESFANPAHSARILSSVPLARFGQPGDVASAIRYLASPGAEYVNGQTLVVDGGFIVS